MSQSVASSSTEVLPPLYARWVDELLRQPLPLETLATCHDCVMCKPPGPARPAPGPQFKPSLKCCTYLPTLPNFLVGAVLADSSPDAAEGRATMERRVAAGVAVTPAGVTMTPVYKLLYQGGKLSGFGRATALKCPHYIDREGGQCGIWRHRNSVCSTYFCTWERGVMGQRFWQEMVALLQSVEFSLGDWCVQQLDVGTEALQLMFPPPDAKRPSSLSAHDLDGLADAELQRAVWGRWYGREREFYVEAARLVAPLAWADVARLGGPGVSIHAQLLGAAYTALMSDEVPEYLQVSPFDAAPIDEAFTRVWSRAGRHSPIEVPTPLVSALRHFDGRTRTQDAIFSVVFETRTGLQKWLVRRLVDCGILSAAGTGASGTGASGEGAAAEAGVAPLMG